MFVIAAIQEMSVFFRLSESIGLKWFSVKQFLAGERELSMVEQEFPLPNKIRHFWRILDLASAFNFDSINDEPI
jgi:hypothetical protein